jgi:tRNA modification GTPase
VGELDVEFCISEMRRAQDELSKLLLSADRGILLRSGAQVVLVGRPNAGKSSLMNTLLRHERAIVTDVPGTTRDTLEETVNLGGVAVRLWDTAGLRSTDDPVELIGVERSRLAISSADLVVLVVDATLGLCLEDSNLINSLPKERLLVAWNKCDLNQEGDLQISAKSGAGIAELESAIVKRLLGDNSLGEAADVAITNVHQRTAVELAGNLVSKAIETATQSLPADLISVDVQGALRALGEVTGETTGGDVINEIFSKFCIGK